MITQQTEALLLRSVAFGESDQIVHLLTPQMGRVTAIAKGARRSIRRFPGTLDLMNHLSVHVVRRKPTVMARLESARLLTLYDRLRTNPVRFGLACSLIELLDRLAPEGGPPNEMARLFRFALDALGAIETQRADARLRVFLRLRTLAALGLGPELRDCVRCGRVIETSARIAFLIADGGPVCATCEIPGHSTPLRVYPGTLRALEQALVLPLDRLARLSVGASLLSEAEDLIARFHRFHVGIELRSDRFLAEILGQASSPRGSQASRSV